MARQPEVAGNIQTAMIIAAALIEGVTFFALIVCMLQDLIRLRPIVPAIGWSNGSKSDSWQVSWLRAIEE